MLVVQKDSVLCNSPAVVMVMIIVIPVLHGIIRFPSEQVLTARMIMAPVVMIPRG